MKKKRTLQVLRYIAMTTFAFTVGLVLMQAVQTDAETDRQIEQIDRFIESHEVGAKSVRSTSEVEPETVSISYKEWEDGYGSLETDNSDSVTDDRWCDPIGGDMVVSEAMPEEETEGTGTGYMEAVITPEEFMQAGIIDWNGWRYTYYSEQVLPGGGLQIPGRWSDGQFVRDENGYLCVASNVNDLPFGTYVDTPFGTGIVYDCGCDPGIIDIYVSFN